MSIRDEARAAQRRMPEEFWREMSGEQYFEEGFRQGVVWASEQADRAEHHTFATDACVTRECECAQGEPSEAEVVEWAASVPQVEKYPTFAAGWEEAALHVLDLARGETNEREKSDVG